MRDFKLCTIALVLGVSQASYASEITELEQCMLREINTGDQNRTVAQIEALCLHQQNETAVEIDGLGVTSQHKGVLSERLARERIAAFNPFVITPHKMNYILNPFIIFRTETLISPFHRLDMLLVYFNI